ncbi:MAG: hypothetical protein OXP37_00290 [Chloroflexota bacterium]|nr:hypothetical protein [Chloroflexota bacterium]
MRVKIALIDDEDRSRLPSQIQRLDGTIFEVVPLPPPPNLDLRELLVRDADLYLVDYELDTRQRDGTIAPYLGMTLAARLREARPDYPIVLLTRSDLPKWTDAQRTVKTGGSFDDIVYKDTGIGEDPQGTCSKLISLARGYSELRQCSGRTVGELLSLLRTDQTGQISANEALPPPDGWKEFEAAYWVRSVLIRFPGVLYGEAHAATALGLSLGSFRLESIQQILSPAVYSGPFCEEQRRWWRHSIFDIANSYCSVGDSQSSRRGGFRRVASERIGLELEPASDIESGNIPADTVCYVLGEPVRIETSLPYRPDARPPVMEESRVSFRAIRESNEVDENYIGAANRSKLDEIRSP